MASPDNDKNAEAVEGTVQTVLIIYSIFVILYTALFIWALFVSISFPLPKNIKILCIVLTLIGLPIISLPLAYGFKGKK